MEPLLAYFKQLAERDEKAENWHSFWERHKVQIRAHVSPGSYLRFKTQPMAEVYKLLRGTRLSI